MHKITASATAPESRPKGDSQTQLGAYGLRAGGAAEHLGQRDDAHDDQHHELDATRIAWIRSLRTMPR